MGKRTTLQNGYTNNYLKFHHDDGEVDRHGSAIAWFTCMLCDSKPYKIITASVVRGKNKSCRHCSYNLMRTSQHSILTKYVNKEPLTREEIDWCKVYKSEANVKWHSTLAGRCKLMLGNAEERARKKELAFDLTEDWLMSKLKRRKCEVTGIELDFNRVKGYRNCYTPTLDRKDSNKGYTQENSQVVVYI
jgi:hypothetical protein